MNNIQRELIEYRKRDLIYFALERLLEDSNEDSVYKETEIVEAMEPFQVKGIYYEKK